MVSYLLTSSSFNNLLANKILKFELNPESVKIKKPGLTTKGDVKLSKKMADILNGTKDRRDFEKKVESLLTKEELEVLASTFMKLNKHLDEEEENEKFI